VKPTVLVVDDSLTVRMDLEEAFAEAEVATVLCASAAEARQAVARTPVDAVVLDVVLPDGDGAAFVQELRANPLTAKLPVLMLSSENEVRARIRGVTTGADDYAGKPYDRAYVVARVQDWLRTRQPPARRTGPVILLVDHDVGFGAELRDAFAPAGGKVLVARSGEEGLRMAAATRPDAVVVGGGMPDLDGAGLVRRLKLDAAMRRTPCLLITAASCADNNEVSALESGADSFVARAEEATVIAARIFALLRGRRPAEDEVTHASSLGPQKILSVDDSPTYLHALADEIRNEGYDVVLATSGEEALALLAAQSVDCIVLDLVMPGLSGKETCRLIKSSPALREIPLVVLSGYDDPESKVEAFNLGADDFVPKTDSFDVIKARLRAQIRRKHMETEVRDARERLLRKEKAAAEAAIRARDDFLAIASHELRTPLATLTLHLENLQREFRRLGDGAFDGVEKALRQTRRLTGLVDGMLDVSLVATGRMKIGRETVDLVTVTTEVIQRLARDADRAGCRISLRSSSPAEGLWDRQRMDQLVANLLSNAITYGAGGPIEVTLATDIENVRLSIRDHGIGISRDDLPRIFNRFERAVSAHQYTGLGLGLYLTRQIVDAHGGSIDVASEPGRGSLFTVRLPRFPSADDRRSGPA
jgi:two-component system, NtrC family, sensor kinase